MTHILRTIPAAQNRVQQSFQRGLPSYHAASVVQAQIAAHLGAALRAAGAPVGFNRALEFGCGTGHLTAQLVQQFRIEQLILNDLVPDCADALQPILQDTKTRVDFQAGAIETLAMPVALDLIASASTVQWVPDLAGLMQRLTAHLAPGGWIAISGFGRGHFAELQALGGFGKAPSYLDPQEWREILPSGLKVHRLEQRRIAMPFSDSIALLRHLRLTGVNGAARRQWTRADLADFDTDLRAGQPEGAALRLTYCPVILIAQKAA